jgi:hypothetical protein
MIFHGICELVYQDDGRPQKPKQRAAFVWREGRIETGGRSADLPGRKQVSKKSSRRPVRDRNHRSARYSQMLKRGYPMRDLTL